MDYIKMLLKGQNNQNINKNENALPPQEEPLDLITKIRDIDKKTKKRDSLSDEQYQKLIDEIFQTHGVIVQVNTIDYGKELVSLAGNPLKSGDVEYLKTTPAGYDHFIVYHAKDYKNPAGLDALKAVCDDFGLNFNKKSNQVIRLMQTNSLRIPLVAEMFGKGYRHGIKSKKGIILPYEVLGINKEYSQEEKLLKTLAKEVYRVHI